MRNPRVVLASLAGKSSSENYKYDRLYRNLYNPEFFCLAYQHLYGKPVEMMEGVNNDTADGMSLEKINNLIERLKDQSYQPAPIGKADLPKRDGSNRPGIPSVEDQLVQEAVRMIQESIYEGKFEDTSHGFRPNKSCHTAIMQIQQRFSGVRWFVKGNIGNLFDNIDRHTLISLLRKSIEDEKFINLIWKFLKAGYMKDWKWRKCHGGAPEGSIIGPILSNIYFHELDKYMKEYKVNFDKGKMRGHSSEYVNAAARIRHYQDKISAAGKETEKGMEYLQKLKKLETKLKNTPSKNQMDKNFRRLFYTRHAGDFIVGIIGAKEDAEKINEDVTLFLKTKLNLQLPQENINIIHSAEKTRFLSYDITTERGKNYRLQRSNGIKSAHHMPIRLYVPHEHWEGKLRELDVLDTTKEGQWKGKARPRMQQYDDLEILLKYNSEIRRLYDYFRLAHNANVLNKFCYIMEQSMLKTFASKYRTSVSEIWGRYSKDGRFRVRYKTKKGEEFAYFIDKVKRQND
ncbi:Type II intron maturase [Bacillus sp. OV322]|uniref:reverse transcriptase/maturase family protein n=1 Tax=Bacillus sp. OV322 TaxID=1882764 RepID=UPI0008F0ADA2|nr:reverse transcriptase/maturase family protein [Bacillus sp. OV322]SFB96388.1 Type II intron maturase [Bacillus sp. OV322]